MVVDTCEMAACELKIIVLIPVFERKCGEWCGVGELQVSEMPVQDLTVT